jgi:hypothetical protein
MGGGVEEARAQRHAVPLAERLGRAKGQDEQGYRV